MKFQEPVNRSKTTNEPPAVDRQEARGVRAERGRGAGRKLERAPIYWIDEAIAYLGLDRLGLNKPEQAIYRMVRKGILRPRKIGRYLAFTKGDLDYVITNGEKRRSPGRPKRLEK